MDELTPGTSAGATTSAPPFLAQLSTRGSGA